MKISNLSTFRVLTRSELSKLKGGQEVRCENYGHGNIICKCYSDETQTGEDTETEVPCEDGGW